MKVLRSWPAAVPPGRAHVVDDVPRLVMSDFDYRCLAEVDDDVLLLEWDIAVDRAGLRAFAARAASEPDRVLVAPYLIYDGPREQVWAHREWRNGGFAPVETGAKWCNLFGLGLAYLPRSVVLGYLASEWKNERMTDGALSQWHWRSVAERVPIAWGVRPVHLHYRSPVARIEATTKRLEMP